jgi:hypothetical protein
MAAYGDRDSQRVLPIAPIRNQFSGEQPTSYMSLHPVEDVGVSLLLYLDGRVIVSFSLEMNLSAGFGGGGCIFQRWPACCMHLGNERKQCVDVWALCT